MASEAAGPASATCPAQSATGPTWASPAAAPNDALNSSDGTSPGSSVGSSAARASEADHTAGWDVAAVLLRRGRRRAPADSGPALLPVGLESEGSVLKK